MSNNTEERRIDFNRDGYLLLHLDRNKITGYTSSGLMLPGNPQALVHESLLPEEFFNDFFPGKFLYYSSPEKVIEDPDFVDPREYEEEPTSNVVSSREVTLDGIWNELKEIKATQEEIIRLFFEKEDEEWH